MNRAFVILSWFSFVAYLFYSLTTRYFLIRILGHIEVGQWLR